MSNLNDRGWIKTSRFENSMRFTTMRRTEFFYEKSPGLGTNLIGNNSKQSALNRPVTRQTGFNSSKIMEENQVFKIPSFDRRSVKKPAMNPIKSPIRRVQTGRVKNDLKVKQQSRKSFLSHPTFINSRGTLHCSSRNNQFNCRKEVIKKMVYLAECALKENKEIKLKSTPVKVLAGLTPRNTPNCKGYLMLPEFKKMGLKLDMENVTQEGTNKEVTIKVTPLSEKKNESIAKGESKLQQNEVELNNKTDFGQILRHCRIYNTEVGFIYGKLRMLEECFEKNIKELPDYQVYDEFCLYQSKKEELYEELKLLEDELKNTIQNQTRVGSKLKDYVKKRRELFEKRTKLHKCFEESVKSALEKLESSQGLESEICELEMDTNGNEETPKLRRSLRLSKLASKNKPDENSFVAETKAQCKVERDSDKQQHLLLTG